VNWYNEKITKKDINEIRSFLAVFGVRIQTKPNKQGAIAYYQQKLIEIDLNEYRTIQKFLSLVLHELWHCLCYEQGLYKNYHYTNPPKTKKEIQRIRRIGYKAERFVDKKAREMMKNYFPGIPYYQYYIGKEDKVWYYKTYLDKYYPLERK
jgi:hypothetical protein